jgi:hypothetical protein
MGGVEAATQERCGLARNGRRPGSGAEAFRVAEGIASEKVADAARKEELLREFHAGGITKLTHYVSAQIAARGESAHTHLAAVVGKLSDFDDLKLAEFAPKIISTSRWDDCMRECHRQSGGYAAKGLIETFKNEVKLIGDPAVQANYRSC